MTRTNRRATFRWTATLALLLLSSPLAAQAAPAPIVAPANLPATPAFTAAWQKARASFNQCHYTSAVSRYVAIGSYGTRLDDPVAQFKFLAGIATAYSAAGTTAGQTPAVARQDTSIARAYARVAVPLWKFLSVAQQDDVQSQAGDIGDVTIGEYYHSCSPSTSKPPAARSATTAHRGRVLTVARPAARAATTQACHISAAQGYSKVMGVVKATGLSCAAAKPVITSLDRAPIKGFQGTFTRTLSGQRWRCSWSRTSDSTVGYTCTASAKKLAWTFGQP
jgi:hypothetical protein